MSKDPEIVAEEIAQMVGGHIEFYEDPETGECYASIETDDHGDAKGDGLDRKSAFESLVAAADEVGWEAPEPIYP